MRPSLALIPSAFNTGKLYSVLPEDGSGDFTVSRNGNATYFDKNGILRTALPNEPRFDFDPLTGQFRGVLVEPAATNVLLNSETPATQTLLMTAAQRTISFYGSGTVTLSGAFSATITGNANPLIRTTFTFTPTATNLTITPSGNVTRYQLELGPVATSYIPTSGSQVTRPADVITRTNAQDLIGQTEGSLYIDAFANSVNGFSHLVELSSPTNSDRVFIFMPAEQFGRAEYTIVRNSVQVGSSASTVLNNQLNKRVVMIWTSSNLKVFINGQLFLNRTLTQSAPLNQMSVIRFFLAGNNRPPITYIRRFSLFKTALSDEQAISITSL